MSTTGTVTARRSYVRAPVNAATGTIANPHGRTFLFLTEQGNFAYEAIRPQLTESYNKLKRGSIVFQPIIYLSPTGSTSMTHGITTTPTAAAAAAVASTATAESSEGGEGHQPWDQGQSPALLRKADISVSFRSDAPEEHKIRSFHALSYLWSRVNAWSNESDAQRQLRGLIDTRGSRDSEADDEFCRNQWGGIVSHLFDADDTDFGPDPDDRRDKLRIYLDDPVLLW